MRRKKKNTYLAAAVALATAKHFPHFLLASYIYIHTYICTRVYTHTCIFMYIRVQVYTLISLSVCIQMYSHFMFKYIYMHVGRCIYIKNKININIYIDGGGDSKRIERTGAGAGVIQSINPAPLA